MRPLALLAFAALLLVGGCHPRPAPVADNPDLAAYATQDAADRQTDTWSAAIDQHDAAHRQGVRALLAAGRVRTAADHYHAALVMQHGEDSTDYGLAHRHAVKAETLGDPRARWLAAATLDRYLLSFGQPQRYGTQFAVRDGRWYLQAFDSLALSAAERRRAGVPSTDSLRAYLRARNHSATASLAPPPPPAPPRDNVELIGGLDGLGRQMQYPAAARAAKVEGGVQIQLTVQPDGSVGEALVIDGPGYGLNEEALRVIRQARFINHLGEPWEIRLRVPCKL